MQNINKFQVAPLQAEINEYILTPEGSLVKSNANKKHSAMKSDFPTDYLPNESYVFSNDPDMVLLKKGAKEIEYGMEYHNYVEGKPGKVPKKLTFDKFFPKDKSTPAEIVKKIASTYKVLDEQVHIDNPFIRRANSFNKETRMKPLQIVLQLNEQLRPKTDEELMQQASQQQTQQPTEETSQFKYGGYHKALKQYQSGGEIFSGAASGASAGAFLGPWGMAGGALIGGLGSLLIGSKKTKEAKEQERLRAALMQKLNQNNEAGYNASNLSTFAKAALPVPKYDYLNLDSNIDRTNSTYGDILASENSRRSGSMSVNNGMINTGIRALTGSGANPTQVSNYVNNAIAQGIQAGNQLASQYDNYYDSMKLGRAGQLNGYDEALARDKQFGTNLTENNRYNRNQNAIGEFGNNFQDFNNKKSNLLVDDYSSQQALRQGAAAERAGALGQFSTALGMAGSAGAAWKNQEKTDELFEQQKRYNEALIAGNVKPSNPASPIPVTTPWNIAQTGLPQNPDQEYYEGMPVQVHPVTGRKFVTDRSGNMVYIN